MVGKACESKPPQVHIVNRNARTCTKCHQIVLGARGYEANAANSLSSWETFRDNADGRSPVLSPLLLTTPRRCTECWPMSETISLRTYSELVFRLLLELSYMATSWFNISQFVDSSRCIRVKRQLQYTNSIYCLYERLKKLMKTFWTYLVRKDLGFGRYVKLLFPGV